MKNRLLILSLLVSVPVFAWQPQTGDIIFQISRSSQSKAIQLATHSDYSHTGMLVMRNKKPYIFEAVGPVKYTPLKQWIAHGEKDKYVVRRVEGGLSVEQQQKLTQTAKRYLGKPYDFSFSWSDDRHYCSEVVWKVYQNALGMRVGEQQKLKEFDLSNPLVQAKLKERYGKNIPLECVFRSIRSRIGIEVRSAIRIHSINRELNFFYRFLTRFFAAFHYRGIFPQ
ncbi:hypothetical protein AB26_4418 [Escherichia coli 2-011-08_S1_C2]|nr:hypothetical protein AB26_4418 [Escherichia coli 2-011-08_S1_C2]